MKGKEKNNWRENKGKRIRRERGKRAKESAVNGKENIQGNINGKKENRESSIHIDTTIGNKDKL